MSSGSDRLKDALHKLRPPPPKPLNLQPSNAFEVAIAEQLRALRCDVDRLQARLNWLFALIVGAAIANVVLSLLQ